MPRKRRSSSSASTIAASSAAPASTTSSARTPRIAPNTRLCCVTSSVPERPEIAEAQHDVEPLARDERVDERDHERERHAEDARAQQLAAGAGQHAGGEDRDAEAAEHERVLERERRGDERAGVGGGDRRARRVQRAGPRLAAGIMVRRGVRSAARAAGRPGRWRRAKRLRRTRSSNARARRRQRRPRRCRSRTTRAGARAGAWRRRARRRRRAARRPARAGRAATGSRPRRRSARRRRWTSVPCSMLRASGVPSRSRRPRPDEDAQRRVALGAAKRAARRVDAEPVQPSRDRIAGGRPRQLALDLHRRPAARAVQERLGERADDGRHVGRQAPVVVVPPDPVAAGHAQPARALVGEDPVEVDEPVHGPAAAPPAGDAGDRPARSRRRSAS